MGSPVPPNQCFPSQNPKVQEREREKERDREISFLSRFLIWDEKEYLSYQHSKKLSSWGGQNDNWWTLQGYILDNKRFVLCISTSEWVLSLLWCFNIFFCHKWKKVEKAQKREKYTKIEKYWTSSTVLETGCEPVLFTLARFFPIFPPFVMEKMFKGQKRWFLTANSWQSTHLLVKTHNRFSIILTNFVSFRLFTQVCMFRCFLNSTICIIFSILEIYNFLILTVFLNVDEKVNVTGFCQSFFSMV